MRLKKLELYGFKSFPSRTEIVFGEGITGIVGPNGSGKSNIGDAVRWVLGEQSAKTLRGSSMSDVIFNGTQRRKPLSYCEVSLLFDNEDRSLPMDFAEVMVTRRVYRNGESEYYLNRSACRLKDIVDLFRDTGIGREGYSIIGQGRIDEILSRKSEDRRQVFEEAAGITKFKTRKEEADRKLERTLENAARVDDILEELTRRLGPLEEQSRTARRYLELTGELKGLDLTLFLIRTDRMQKKLADLDTELAGLREAVGQTEETIREKSAGRDACQERIAALEERISAARAGLMEAAEAVHARQSDLTEVENRVRNRAENRARVTGEQERAAGRIASLDSLRTDAEAAIAGREGEARAAEEALEKATEQSAEKEAASAAAEEALEEHKEAIVRAMNRLSAVQNDQTRLKTMRSQMSERLEELDRGGDALRAEEETLRAAVGDAERRLADEEALFAEKETAHAEAQRAFDTADAELIRLRAEGEKLSAALQADHSRWRLLDEMTREMEGYSQSVRRAVQYSRDRRVPGVRGVLAQLIRVPARYETAIDMALGAAQQNIVTDTEETAKQLIDYLRQNRLGRATFLPMSAIRGKVLSQRERQVLGMPGCIGVASELIECDEAYRPIVENLLGRTVIADGLANGIRIQGAAGHAFRLVTLEGDVMHSGGSMTGGSSSSKMVSLLSRERELKELTERLRKGKQEFEGLKAAIAAKQEEKNALRQGVADALEAMHQQEIAVARETERVGSAKAELEGHAARAAQTAQAVAQLTDAIAEIDRQMSEAGATGDSARMDREAMEARTAELQEALAQARREAQEAADAVLAGTLALSDVRHDLDVMRRDSGRWAEDREQLERESAERTERLAAMDKEDAEDSARGTELAGQIAAMQEDRARRERETAALEEERAGEQRGLADLLREIEGLYDERTRDADRIHRAELSRSRTDSELRSMTDRVWNTWELTYAGAEAFRLTEGFNEREADRRCAEINAEIRSLGSVNVHAVDEYAETKARFDELTAQQNDLRRAEADLRELIDRLIRQMTVTFKDNFSKLQGFFTETFTRLFGGGHAELTLMDPDDPLNCGIEVNAQPPGKKLQLLSLLSGGERALTAIAILFAMLKLKPTPFCILDEIEAALDDANIGYYADYLREYSRDTQFIVVTHRKGTMERCNALYGVAMEEQGVSKMVSVSLQDYEEPSDP